MWNLLIENIAKKGVQLNEEEQHLVLSRFRYKKFRKNQYILQAGDVARYDTFVLKGLLRTYKVDERGQENIIYFSPEDWWAGDLYSFHKNVPSSYNIDCLEETEVLQITRQSIELLCEQVPKMNIFYQRRYRSSIIAHENRTASVLTKTTLERYQEFIRKHTTGATHSQSSNCFLFRSNSSKHQQATPAICGPTLRIFIDLC